MRVNTVEENKLKGRQWDRAHCGCFHLAISFGPGPAMGTMGTSGLEAIEPRQAAASMDRGELLPLRVEAAGTKFDTLGTLWHARACQ